METPEIEIGKQIESFKARVVFLKEWKSYLESNTGQFDFEGKDKIYKLTIEIESKEALIEMRLKDIEQFAKQKEAQDNEVKANYAMAINRIKELKTEEPQLVALIKGFVDRSTNPELPMEEMAHDYKIMKSILMSQGKKETPVIKLQTEKPN